MMSALMWLSPLALGADPSAFPLQAELQLCEGCDGAGAYRFEVPLPLREAEWLSGDPGLMLVNAEGRVVPVAWLAAGGLAETGAVRLIDAGVFGVQPVAREVDGLDVRLPGVDIVRVSVWAAGEGGRATPLAGPVVVARGNGGLARTNFRFPATRAPLRVQVDSLQGSLPTDIEATLWFGAGQGPSEHRLIVPFGAAQPEEYGNTRHPLRFDGVVPRGRLEVMASEPVYERDASLVGAAMGSGEAVTAAYGRVRRVQVGGADVRVGDFELTELGPVSEVALAVSSDGGPPLTFTEAVLVVPGLQGLLLDPGPGPFTLLAGGPTWAVERSDLAVATPELARLAVRAAAVGAVAPNPAWAPPERVSGVVGPGQALDLRRMRWAHTMSGEGLVRVDLPVEVLANARPDLGDLRVVDAESRERPFFTRQLLTDRPLQVEAPVRSEQGAISRLRVKLPEAGLRLSRVTLFTDATAFDREVVIERAVGRRLELVRATTWRAQGGRGTTRLDLNLTGERFGDELIVRIENGDNPPLPVRAVEVSGERWELVTDLPAGGARLVYGDRRRDAPDYDLALFRQELGLRVRQVGGLGPAEALSAPPIPTWDKAVIYAGLGVLVLGLLGLLAVLARSSPQAAGPAGAAPAEPAAGA